VEKSWFCKFGFGNPVPNPKEIGPSVRRIDFKREKSKMKKEQKRLVFFCDVERVK
jgi:hypothetical protein